ncbi:MAG TPA: glycosyltransferase family 39 protein [Solirubrobacteraceae bacterium]
MRRPLRQWEWAAIALITLGAAVLRLLYLGRVSPDPFYDAAVRSMGLSFHNFFFGAFEPGGSVSIDKPPVDLWLQVASVKAFGFSSTTLKLPEAFAGIASVPLLFAAVRRMWSVPAGLAAAAAMAVLPVEVITSRSDTMDAVMMALIVLALLLLVRAVETGSTAWLLAAAAALGLAFNVKLLETLVALPGLTVFAYLGLGGPRGRRLLRLGLAGAVYVAVALSWLTATLLVPAGHRPYAIGSTNGSAWNAAFVFNGTDRLGGKSPEHEAANTIYIPGHHYPEATQSERDHIPIVPPSATRLLARVGPLSGQRLGLQALVALLLGIPGLLWGVLRPEEELEEALAGERSRAKRRSGRTAGGLAQEPAAGTGTPAGVAGGGVESASPPAASATSATGATPAQSGPAATVDRDSVLAQMVRMRRAGAAGLGVWMLSGIVLFSQMARLHPRYVEGFTPAVAGMLGIGVAWAASPRGRWRLAILAGSLLITVYYAERLLYGTPGAWWVALLAALGAVGLAAIARIPGRSVSSLVAPAGVLALTLVAVLAIPLSADVTAINDGVTDAGYVGALPSEEQRIISDYLRAHQGSARYELAAQSATQIGSLIVQDARPVLVLTTYAGRVLTTVPELKSLIAQGKVRYAFLSGSCSPHSPSSNPACSEPAKWIRAHGTDVSLQAGLPHHKTLWLLPGATP